MELLFLTPFQQTRYFHTPYVHEKIKIKPFPFQACGKYMPATAATVQSNQISATNMQDGTYLVEESF